MNPTQLIDEQAAKLPGWQAETYTQLRSLINAADPKLIEEWKWRTAVWERGGLICALGVFKSHLKINFFQGAALPDPKHSFNAGLDAKVSRGIDFHEGDPIDAPALTALVQAAVRYNLEGE